MSQALTRSRSPRTALRLARMARVASRAEPCAAWSVTSLGTLPNGPAGDPSAARAPWPETNARLPRTRTQARGSLLPQARRPGPAGSVRAHRVAVLRPWVPACTTAIRRRVRVPQRGPWFQQYEPRTNNHRPNHRRRLTGFVSCRVLLGCPLYEHPWIAKRPGNGHHRRRNHRSRSVIHGSAKRRG